MSNKDPQGPSSNLTEEQATVLKGLAPSGVLENTVGTYVVQNYNQYLTDHDGAEPSWRQPVRDIVGAAMTSGGITLVTDQNIPIVLNYFAQSAEATDLRTMARQMNTVWPITEDPNST